MLPAISRLIVTATGGEPMQMRMILTMTPVRMEDHDRAAPEGLALDGAVESIQALDPTAHKRTQHNCCVLVKGGTEHRRHRQDAMPIDDSFMEDPTDLTNPVIDVDFGTP